MKKYQLGALTVKDKGLQDTKEEIVIELIDRMQKYVAQGKAAFENREFTKKQRLNQIEHLCGRFCGLSDFLQATMGIEVRREDGFMYTQEMFNHFHYWKMNLEIEIKKERERQEATVFEAIAKDAPTLAGFLRSLPVLEAPWDDAFHKRYCAGCSAENCDTCPNQEFRSNPEWWLSLDAEGAEL